MVFIVTLNTFGYSVISSVHALYACQYALCTQIHLLIHLFTCRGDWDVWVNLQEKHWDTGIHDELYSLLLLLFYECIHQISITVFFAPVQVRPTRTSTVTQTSVIPVQSALGSCAWKPHAPTQMTQCACVITATTWMTWQAAASRAQSVHVVRGSTRAVSLTMTRSVSHVRMIPTQTKRVRWIPACPAPSATTAQKN